mmetsp:Transcript_92176/g.246432  ORF Transcript_92176/g.246432 Transcript_92176/m.246432 type:complete len:91 (+) Transcript_92176:144-416(+)
MLRAANVTILRGHPAIHHLPRILRLLCPNLSSAIVPAPLHQPVYLQCPGTHREQVAVVDSATTLAVLSVAVASPMIQGSVLISGSYHRRG